MLLVLVVSGASAATESEGSTTVPLMLGLLVIQLVVMVQFFRARAPKIGGKF